LNPPQDVPRVFISYRHDSPEHVNRVLDLSNRLRADGIDCHLDQYEPSPREGWLRWMLNQINAAEFVLVVCTEKYRLRFEGKEQPGFGLGANREGSIIDQRIYEAGGRNDKFLPVVFSASDRVHIPETLRAWTYYQLGDERAYEQLYRRLTNQPEVAAPTLGPRRAMPPRERKQDFSRASPLWEMPHRRDLPLDYLKRNQGREIRGFMDIWQRELLGLIQEAGESIDPVRSGLATGRCVIYPARMLLWR
jgi:hypothetical protein